MNITEVKNLIPIKQENTKYDTYLNTIIPMLEEFAKTYCKQSFTDDTGAEAFPGPVKIFVAKAAQYNMNPAGVNSRGAPGTSVSYEMDFPASIMRYLKAYRKVYQ